MHLTTLPGLLNNTGRKSCIRSGYVHHAHGFGVPTLYNGHDSALVLKAQLLQCATAHWRHKKLDSSTS